MTVGCNLGACRAFVPKMAVLLTHIHHNDFSLNPADVLTYGSSLLFTDVLMCYRISVMHSLINYYSLSLMDRYLIGCSVHSQNHNAKCVCLSLLQLDV